MEREWREEEGGSGGGEKVYIERQRNGIYDLEQREKGRGDYFVPTP